MSARNPFAIPPFKVGGETVHPLAINTDDRLVMVARFDRAECQAALRRTDLQQAVERAVRQRLDRWVRGKVQA